VPRRGGVPPLSPSSEDGLVKGPSTEEMISRKAIVACPMSLLLKGSSFPVSVSIRGRQGRLQRRQTTSEKVLLIDDEPDLLEAMAERMRMLGMDVSTTTSVWDAFEKVEAHSYDAIVLDLIMPEMDGFDALRVFKVKKPGVPVILITGHATVSMGMEANKLGAMDLIEKPADLKVLTEKIKRAKAKRLDEERVGKQANKSTKGKGG
jgi:CheY-like chemotaxis protein